MSVRWGPGSHLDRRRGERRQPSADPLYVPGDEPPVEPLRSGRVFVLVAVAIVFWLVLGFLAWQWMAGQP